MPKVLVPFPVVRALLGFKLWCSATGTPPVYTTIVKNSIVMSHARNTATVLLFDEGNYTCVATSKYGADSKVFPVIFSGETLFFKNRRRTPTHFFWVPLCFRKFVPFMAAIHQLCTRWRKVHRITCMQKISELTQWVVGRMSFLFITTFLKFHCDTFYFYEMPGSDGLRK